MQKQALPTLKTAAITPDRLSAFSSHYDGAINRFFTAGKETTDKELFDFTRSGLAIAALRRKPAPSYATYYGDLEGIFDKLHGKELS